MSGSRRLPARLLVDLPNWVGDQMMALPAVDRLVEGNRSGVTVLHTRPAMIRLLALVFPSAVVVASPRKAAPLASAVNVCRGRGRHDVGVTLRNAARAKILISLAARWTLGSRGEGARLLLSKSCTADRGRHQIFDNDAILETLGLPAVEASWRPALPIELAREGEEALSEVGISGGPVVGLAPATARGRAKRWPASRFGRLAAALAARGLQPIVVLGPGEESLARELCEASDRRLPVVGPRLDVAGLAGVISGLSLLVCNDSGPMHLAAVFNIPTVAIFGPGEPSRTGPVGHHHRVLYRRVECAPCVAPQCPFEHHDCVRAISVGEVEAAVVESLGERKIAVVNPS